jgi:hypothetical protein
MDGWREGEREKKRRDRMRNGVRREGDEWRKRKLKELPLNEGSASMRTETSDNS